MNAQRSFTALAVAALAFSAGTARNAQAVEVILPSVPLIVSIDAVPNVWFQLDDSGSMDWEILAGFHLTSCRYNSLTQCNTQFPTTDGLMQVWTGRWNNDGANPQMTNLAYVFDLGDDDHMYDTDCPGGGNGGSWGDCYADNGTSRTRSEGGFTRTYPIVRDWRIRSSAVNVQYFDPTTEYPVWPDSNDFSFGQASFSAARSWPVSGERGYGNTFNLGADDDDGNAFYYHYWIDDKSWVGFPATRPTANPPNVANGANGVVDQWDSHIKVTVGSGSVTCEKVTYDPKPFSWPNQLEGINPTVTPASPAECDLATAGLSDNALRQRVANWFQYSRRRTHVARGAVANVADQLPNYRYGTSSINSTGSTYAIPPGEITDYENNTRDMLDILYNTNRRNAGTPLRRGLERVGRIYQGTEAGITSPINLTCQKNFALLFSDGFWNGGNPGTPANDWDGDGRNIGGNGVTVADVAAYYYDIDLRPDLDDAVPTDAFDAANYQHMVTYTIAFGLEGTLEDTDGDGWPNPLLDRSDNWYRNNNQLDRVEDMWHAAWNSRGRYFNAQRPQDLFEKVREALTDIGARIGGAASAAANSGSISSSSRIFQAKFDSSDWHGELLAFPVNDDGTLGGTAIWDANALLNAKDDSELRARKVFTWNNEGPPGGTSFQWPSISATQAALLNRDYNGVPDTPGNEKGQARLEYVLGVDDNEQAQGGDWRDRLNTLGDIVNSDPVFVGFPPFFYPFDGYNSFFSANRNRTGVIYVGANDGMLHAIREETGEEMFAYVPDAVIENLPQLTDPDYAHTFFVDGPPSYGDAFWGGSWKSVLSGGLRSGGQAVYALDVTNPDTFNASNVLWEFSDEVDADLGYVWGEPQIKRMQNGRWAIIVGNGLNNTEADGHASTTGQGALFIIYIDAGIDGWTPGDYKKITVPVGTTTTPNGLFTPAAADIDGDSKVDFIYAGDRFGNMWKFDVTGDEASWEIAFGGQPFFTTPSGSPISDRPAIAAHPQGRTLGQLVLFGTGQYIETTDNDTASKPTESMFALWDFSEDYLVSATVAKTNDYVKADLTANAFADRGNVRVIESGVKADWLDTNGDPETYGWYIDLPQQGERMIRRPVLRDNLVFFVTMTPDPDPCAAGGTGYISVLDIDTGIAPIFPVFDVDGDLDVDFDGDTIDEGDPDDDSDNLVPVGINSPSIPNLPALIYDDRPGFSNAQAQFPPAPNALRGCEAGSARAYTFTTGSNGSILAIETATEALSCGRQNWSGER
ncbi:MAG: PilC/PilY family type IV pilus protein [Xanthomonadales bacterium]|jgi:type IV pilus assembly protein PilY1|nr:PilC/PilY family type IV pilus protein [Xanthomonadales bacterium]